MWSSLIKLSLLILFFCRILSELSLCSDVFCIFPVSVFSLQLKAELLKIYTIASQIMAQCHHTWLWSGARWPNMSWLLPIYGCLMANLGWKFAPVDVTLVSLGPALEPKFKPVQLGHSTNPSIQSLDHFQSTVWQHLYLLATYQWFV